MKLPLLLRAARADCKSFSAGRHFGLWNIGWVKGCVEESRNHTGLNHTRSCAPGCLEPARNEISTTEKELIHAKMLPTTQFIRLNGMGEVVLMCWPEEGLPKARTQLTAITSELFFFVSFNVSKLGCSPELLEVRN